MDAEAAFPWMDRQAVVALDGMECLPALSYSDFAPN